MWIGAAIVENSMEFHENIKNGIASWPSNPSSRNISEETQNTDLKEYMHLYMHCSTIYSSQDLEASQVLIGRWVHNKAVVHWNNARL